MINSVSEYPFPGRALRLFALRSRIRIDRRDPRSIGKALNLVTNFIMGATATALRLRVIASAIQFNTSQK